MRSKIGRAALGALLTAVLAVGAAYAAEPTLTNEFLMYSTEGAVAPAPPLPTDEGTLAVTYECGSAGASSSFSFQATGNANGPYPGSFTQSGTAQFVAGESLASFESTFQIVSDATTIDGALSLDAGQPSYGGCQSWYDEYEQQDLYYVSAQAVVRFTAEISDPSGVFTESGVASVFISCYGVVGQACQNKHTNTRFIGSSVPRTAWDEDGTAQTAASPTAEYPLATSITNPAGGYVSLEEAGYMTSTDEYQFFGRVVYIHADLDGTAEQPIEITFSVHSSLLVDETGAPIDPATVTVLRDGQPAADCDGPGAIAVPDPCVYSRTTDADGNLTLRVLTVHASEWSVVAPVSQPTWAFGGFLRPVDNLPTLNSVKAGSAVPVKFSLSGDQGLSIFASGFPKSETIACDSMSVLDGIEETATAGGSTLSYDATTDTYTYVWKTDEGWAGTCRQLVLKLNDGSVHRANFKLNK